MPVKFNVLMLLLIIRLLPTDASGELFKHLPKYKCQIICRIQISKRLLKLSQIANLLINTAHFRGSFTQSKRTHRNHSVFYFYL